MGVEGTIWFSPSAHQSPIVKELWKKIKDNKHPFPSDKASAIKVHTHKYKSPDQPYFPVRTGESDLFKAPDFARHVDAWATANLQVQIGDIKKTGDPVADEFNEIIMEAFNIAFGNMLKSGNLLTWNLWFSAPELVDQEEWRTHAETWRKSIDADHGAPTGEKSEVRYFDGTPFKPAEEFLSLIHI